MSDLTDASIIIIPKEFVYLRKKIGIIVLCVSLIIIGLVTIIVTAKNNTLNHSEPAAEYQSIALEVINWKRGTFNIPEGEDLFLGDFLAGAGDSIVDWTVIAVSRLGIEADFGAYLTALEKNVIERYRTEELLDRIRATEWHRIALAILSSGGDPTQLAGGTIDLVADGSYNRGAKMPLDAQGVNGPIWGLILMDSMRYDIPENAADSRESVIVSILEHQTPSGGWGFFPDGSSSVDMTAMALQALSPYISSEQEFTYTRKADSYEFVRNVRDVIDEGVEFLRAEFISGNIDSCESTAWAIIVLCALGIDPANDNRFVEGGRSLVDAFLDFRQTDGGFAHVIAPDGTGQSNPLTASTALLALAALVRFEMGQSNIFDFQED